MLVRVRVKAIVTVKWGELKTRSGCARGLDEILLEVSPEEF